MSLHFDQAPIVIEPKAGPADAAMLWMHGLGASGEDLRPALSLLRLPPEHRIALHLPHAPLRPVSLNNGAIMPAWYNLHGLDYDSPIDREGIQEAVAFVHDWLAQQEAAGIPRERLMLAGFSQGGAVALQAGLAAPDLCGGIIGLSTYLPLPEATVATRARIFLAHGLYDEIIRLHVARRALHDITQRHLDPARIRWETWPIAHNIIPEEFELLGEWIQSTLKPA